MKISWSCQEFLDRNTKLAGHFTLKAVSPLGVVANKYLRVEYGAELKIEQGIYVFHHHGP